MNQQSFRAGGMPRADRIQRLFVGGALMFLTISGLFERVEWRSLVALAIQSELLITGLVGRCPIYWACRTRSQSD